MSKKFLNSSENLEKDDQNSALNVEESIENIKDSIISRKNTIMDNDIYKTVFFGKADNKEELVQLIIQICCDDPNIRILSVQVEEPDYNFYLDKNDNLILARGVRYDIRAVSKDKAYFILEFQKRDNKDDIERFVAEAAMQALQWTVETFKPGEKFKNIHKPVVLVFTDYNLLGLGQEKYDFINMTTANGESVPLPFEIMFMDTRQNNQETNLGRLMNDLTQEDPDRMYFEIFKERAKKMATDYRTVSNNTMDIVFNELNKIKQEIEQRKNKEFEKKELKYQESLAQASIELLSQNKTLDEIADLMKMDKNDLETILNNFNSK